MISQKLSQKLQQKLSPQQIQLMKLLQIPTATLEQRIKEEMEANPALDEGADDQADKLKDEFADQKEEEQKADEEPNASDEIDMSDYFDEDEMEGSYRTRDTNRYNDSDDKKTIPIPVHTTFHEHLLNQLGLLSLNEDDEQIAAQIIGSIDDDGYLRREIEAIVDDLAFSANVMAKEERVEEIINQVQNFEPAGVGCRDLRECLLIQLERKRDRNVFVNMATDIIRDHFDAFTKKHYSKLQRSLEIDEDDLKRALEEVLKLNPKPGSAFASTSKAQTYLIPDFLISNQNGELVLTLNSRNAPELRISNSFREMLVNYKETKKKSKKQKETILFVKQKIDSAKWFIEAIRQRQETMLHTMRTIMEHQYDYFLTGDETKLKPMILKDIAEKTGLDISTVSRVANSKYAQTEFGTFLLKSFFSESLQTDSGEAVSTREVKKILTDVIEQEDKRKPHSDQKLTELLKEKGYNIARRTVAKYREQLGIPVARLRKEL